MTLTKIEISKQLSEWLCAWNEHQLDKVLKIVHDDVIFENWTGSTITGKNNLRKSWITWFNNHGNFKFFEEDLFVDDEAQKVLFQWRLEWPSKEMEFKGKMEIRRGVDIIHFLNGKIYRKAAYSKTKVQIEDLSSLQRIEK
jgi:hypothetical protein